MDAQEVSDLVNKQVDARLDVRMKELGVNKLNETFTRYRIIATTLLLLVGFLIGTQAYTKWFTEIFYDMFPIPENHVAVAYSEVFELSLNRKKPNLLLKAMKFHANKYQRIKLYLRKESVPFVADLDVTMQLDDQDITEFKPAGGFQSMPVEYENGVNRQDGVHTLVFKVADTLDAGPMITSSVGEPKKGAAIITVIVLVFGNAEYDS